MAEEAKDKLPALRNSQQFEGASDERRQEIERLKRFAGAPGTRSDRAITGELSRDRPLATTPGG